MFPISSRIAWCLGAAQLILAMAAAAADFNVVNNGATSYLINNVNDPTLVLVRGQTYTFSIAATGHPFWIKTAAVAGTGSAYNTGVTGNGTSNGTLTFTVPQSAPNALFYICQFHVAMQGTLTITNPPPPPPALLSNPRIPSPGEFRFDVTGTAGREHVLEASTNAATGWVGIASNTPLGSSFMFSDTNAGSFPARWYRVLTR